MPSSARAVEVDDAIVVAAFDESSNGATLSAYDRATGALRWNAKMGLAGIVHSLYRTDVALAEAFGKVEVRGEESMQRYYGLFDAKDGAPIVTIEEGR